MASIRASARQKILKNGLLSREELLPRQFLKPDQMLNDFDKERLEGFKDQNLILWGNLGLDESLHLRYVFLSRDKDYLILVYKEKYVFLYDFQTKYSLVPGSFISPEDLGFEGVITCAAFCEIDRCLFVGSLNGEIARIDLNSDNIKQSITPIKSIAKTSISSIDISSDGQTLAYCHFGGITTLDLLTFKELQYHQMNRHYKSAYFMGTEQQNLLITKVRRAILDSGYEIRTRTGGEKPRPKKVNQILKPFEHVKLTQNKKYYVALRNITDKTKTQHTECQVFGVNDHENSVSTFIFDFHNAENFEKLEFHVTIDEKFLFCYSPFATVLYIHHFTNQKTTSQCTKIPFANYQYAAFANDDSCLVLVDQTGEVVLCNLFLGAGSILSRHKLNSFEGRGDSLILSDDGEYLAYFLKNKDVQVLDLRSNQIILSLQKKGDYQEMVSASIRFCNDEIIVEYKIIRERNNGNVQEYAIQEKIPSRGSGLVFRGMILDELQPYQAEDEGEEMDPLHVIPVLKRDDPSTLKELGEFLIPNGRFKPEEAKSDVYDNRSLPSVVEKVKYKFAVKSNGGSYVFVISKDSTVNVYALPSREYVCSWKNNRQRNLISFKISKDDRFILNVYEDGYVEIRDFKFVSQSLSKNISEFYSFERHLGPDKSPLKECLLRPQDYPIPKKQTIIHLKALSNANDLAKLKFNSDSRIPFLLDGYNKTPLHYLLIHDKLSFGTLNGVATYVLEYMKTLKKGASEYDNIVQSLNGLLPILLLKLQPSLAAQYVEMLAPIRLIEEDELESDIFAKGKTVYFREDSFSSKLTEKLQPGTEQMIFKVLDLRMDYRPESKEIMEYTVVLSETEVEDVFKLPAISHLVDYVWDSTKKWNVGLFLWFSILMLLLSVSVGLDERNLGLEITILVFTSIGMIIEIIQAIVLKSQYWITMWNKIDLISLIFIYAYVIHRFYDDDDELAKNWVAAFTIFIGYIRLAAYLRLFDQTRELIEVIVAIIKDMGSFLIIMGMITIGFSLIFLKFLRSDEVYYLWHLYYSYQLWYGNTDGDTNKSPSVLILECVIMFIMPVVLLNLLVTLMGESREKIKEQAVLTDARTRLVMSIEALTLMKAVSYLLGIRKCEIQWPRTSLVICTPKLQDQESESDKNTSEIVNLKEQVNTIEKVLKDSNEKQISHLQRLEGQVLKLHELKKEALEKEIVEQSQKNEESENPSKNGEPYVEFERINILLQGLKTELWQHTLQETIEIKAHIDRILPKPEMTSPANNVISDNAEED